MVISRIRFDARVNELHERVTVVRAQVGGTDFAQHQIRPIGESPVGGCDGDSRRVDGIGFGALNTPMDTTPWRAGAFLQIQAAFAEMEREFLRQRVLEGVKAARARGRKRGRPRVMTIEKLRYAQGLMADRTRSTPPPAPWRELGGLPTSTLYHYRAADGTLKDPSRRLLDG